MATRPSVAEGWGTPMSVGSLNGPDDEHDPWLTSRGAYFIRNVGGANHIFFAPFAPGTAPSFGPPAELSEVASDSGFPVVSSDDLTLYYADTSSSQPVPRLRHRDSTMAAFGAAMAVPGFPDSGYSYGYPEWISPDGCRMYFVVNDGGEWHYVVATRSPSSM